MNDFQQKHEIFEAIYELAEKELNRYNAELNETNIRFEFNRILEEIKEHADNYFANSE